MAVSELIAKFLKAENDEKQREVLAEMDKVQVDRVQEALEVLGSYGVDEFKRELEGYSDEDVLRLWELLEPAFRVLCWRFGLMPPSVRARAVSLHQTIVKLGALQLKANNNGKV